MPRNSVMVPMVATIDGTRPSVTSAPLTQPAARPVPRPSRGQRHGAAPCSAARPIATDASAMMPATEMSISPAMISNASGSATSARSVKLKVASDSVSTLRKYGEIGREQHELQHQHQRPACFPSA